MPDDEALGSSEVERLRLEFECASLEPVGGLVVAVYRVGIEFVEAERRGDGADDDGRRKTLL